MIRVYVRQEHDVNLTESGIGVAGDGSAGAVEILTPVSGLSTEAFSKG